MFGNIQDRRGLLHKNCTEAPQPHLVIIKQYTVLVNNNIQILFYKL